MPRWALPGRLSRRRSGRDLGGDSFLRERGSECGHDAVGVVASRVRRRRHGIWEHGAPIVDPTETYTEILRVASLLLPGVRYRRHTLFRYSLLWTRPDGWDPP